MRIAIVGSGISGLVTAYLLGREHQVTVFEANDYIGGHTHTVPIVRDGVRHPVDTGFVVFNHHNYPNFTRLLEILDVRSEPSQMSFSVRCEKSGLEYNGASLNRMFAQRTNMLRPRFYRMIRDILRFYREAPSLLDGSEQGLSLGEFLSRHRYSSEFIQDHIVPMGCAIWSADPKAIHDFPARYFVQFFANHGFLDLSRRPQWRVISGGSSQYVRALTAGFRKSIRLCCPVESITRHPDFVEVKPRRGDGERFDAVVLATHSDQALRLLEDAGERETDILSAIAYRPNDVVLHTDEKLLPQRPRARASWNYHLNANGVSAPTVTYYMNSLQNIRSSANFCVTLNRTASVDPSTIIREMVYDHPVYTHRAVTAQKRCDEISGHNRTYYCGAYWGFGFHEDGVKSSLQVCRHFGLGL